ncbi:MAG TPA: RtcB family protein [Pirellulaceae bacterium]|nr:RtcB family protein [Pirellulaceae bacterium]
MNNRQLRNLGVPDECLTIAISCVQQAIATGARGNEVKSQIEKMLCEPAAFINDPLVGQLASAIVAGEQVADLQTIEYAEWGTEIDDGTRAQMRAACKVPGAVGAALMPDAHIGYGLPIGGVLATTNSVLPYAVGVDIACRMKLSVLDMPPASLQNNFERYRVALESGTRFGIGSAHEKPQDHAVLDQDWTVCRITRESKERARKQLGSSGSGNHFVEFGLFTLAQRDEELKLDAGEYVALLSHSGSRGTGAAVCDTYSRIAQARLPKKYAELGRLAWLDLDSEAGQEYWAAMNLMGDYAAANHDIIHRLVTKKLGARIVSGIENHHNFAWKEIHNGRELIVHRKGATPAGAGVLGVIPGSMADPAFVVRGKGNAASLNSASHGAGRRMSRTQAKSLYTWKTVQKQLENQGVRVISAGADEVPFAYKNIESVMQAQQDLVEIVARFDPKIVKMCADGSKAED